MYQFVRNGRLTNPPVEIIEHVFLQELHGYTLSALNGEPYDWVLRQFTIINALNEQAANERKQAEQQAKRQRRR